MKLVKDIIRSALRPAVSVSYDAYALNLLRPLHNDFTPWTKYALRPSALCCILNDIIINNRRTVVEFGAGISTLYLATVLQNVGGVVFSIEHDARWSAIVADMISEHNLSTTAHIVRAPLKQTNLSLDRSMWYDTESVKRSVENKRIDVVIVDGPPADTEDTALARFPAVPVIKDRLKDDYIIYLDDIQRRGERRVFRQWERILGCKGSKYIEQGGIGMIRSGSGYSPVL